MGYPICTGTSASEVGWEPVDPSSVNRYCGGGGSLGQELMDLLAKSTGSFLVFFRVTEPIRAQVCTVFHLTKDTQPCGDFSHSPSLPFQYVRAQTQAHAHTTNTSDTGIK
ncbi:rCG29127, isoform CRA_a [Rattus norvegicus]|uniref:RCG29127, isoform CRA_a n=1 Tax=Rattus norvegicus TaxID=10116 RepID=A6KS88_RAT|nr:rCG29127, isoform CRA_a [Rattus norvegicus]EDL83220.1 rCG29127, isoform CRA_a [Rattus norvegicus]